MNGLLTNITGILYESSGYLLLGFGLAGVLHVVLARYPGITALLTGRGKRPVVMSTILGLPLPLCSCSVLPAAMTLRRQGASKGATASFLISVPETDVVSIMLTYGLLGPVMAIYRPIAALVTALAAGLAVNSLDSGQSGGTKPAEAVKSCCHPEPPKTGIISTRADWPWWKRAFHYGFVEIFDDIIRQLFLGLIVAGVLVAWLPSVDLGSFTGGNWMTYLAMLAVGVPLYVCATASTPIAAGLIAGGLSPGAAMVFLLAGPATNIASLFVLRREFGKMLLVVYLIVIAVVSLTTGVLLDMMLRNFIATPIVAHTHDHGATWFSVSATIVFLLLVASSLYRTRTFPKLWGRISGSSQKTSEVTSSGNK